MYRALVIGCGNIGAVYDFENEHVHTHSKAFFLNPAFEFDVFDVDTNKAKTVFEKYGCGIAENIDAKTLAKYDCVSICTPTAQHYTILQKAMEAKVQLIICEKPVADHADDIDALIEMYNESESKILVNYMRRFQPAYQQIKGVITELQTTEKLTNINIRYQRGFVNNCSHAFDIIEYFTTSEFQPENIHISNADYSDFQNDPTLSISAFWNGCNVSIHGLSDVLFSHFEIDFYYQHYKLAVRESGNQIALYRAKKGEGFLLPLQIISVTDNALHNYMENVITTAEHLLSGRSADDNFIQSALMNKRILTYIRQHGKTGN